MVGKDDVIHINVLSAVLFLLLASAFLMLLYFYMSVWFMRVLIILFCIGGFEVSIYIERLVCLMHIPSHALFLLSSPAVRILTFRNMNVNCVPGFADMPCVPPMQVCALLHNL
jgi:hypothetical protein